MEPPNGPARVKLKRKRTTSTTNTKSKKQKRNATTHTQTTFWNEAVEARSRALWSSRGDRPTIQRASIKSWFNVKVKSLQPESWQTTYTSLPVTQVHDVPVDTPTDDDNKKPAAGAVIKYRLYPTPQQWVSIRKAFGAATWTYNKCAEAVKNKTVAPKKEALREYVINNNSKLVVDNPWLKDTPYSIRDEAMIDLLNAMKGLKTKQNKGALKKYTLRFRSKKHPSRTIKLCTLHYKRAGVIFPSYFGKQPIRCAEQLPDKLNYDSILQLTWLGHLYLCVPRPKALKGDNQARCVDKRVVSIDPGLRTFATCYDPVLQKIIEWGRGDMGKIYRLGHHMDKLRSTIQQPDTRHHQRYTMKRAWKRMSLRKQNWVRDFHYRFAHWLCRVYNLILWPEFNTTSMVQRGKRRINSKAVRGLMNWSPATFRDRLMYIASKYRNCQVVIVNEAYTSKTCGKCGAQHNKLGGSKVFNCPQPDCGYTCERDINGARNILLRAELEHLGVFSSALRFGSLAAHKVAIQN